MIYYKTNNSSTTIVKQQKERYRRYPYMIIFSIPLFFFKKTVGGYFRNPL